MVFNHFFNSSSSLYWCRWKYSWALVVSWLFLPMLNRATVFCSCNTLTFNKVVVVVSIVVCAWMFVAFNNLLHFEILLCCLWSYGPLEWCGIGNSFLVVIINVIVYNWVIMCNTCLSWQSTHPWLCSLLRTHWDCSWIHPTRQVLQNLPTMNVLKWLSLWKLGFVQLQRFLDRVPYKCVGLLLIIHCIVIPNEFFYS